MSRFPLTATLVGVALGVLPTDAPAQAEGGVLIQAIAWEVNPADAGKWLEGIQQIVAAAKQANLSSDFGWHCWQEDICRYRLIYPVANMAYFDDPQQWMRQFEGTSGQPTLTKAFEMLNAVGSTTLSEMVLEHVPAWSRETAMDMTTLPHAHVDEIWLRAGTEQEFDAVMKEVVAFLGEVGYVYPVHGYRPRLGGTGEHFIVTFFDTRADYYGEQELERLVEKKGATEKWQSLLAQFSSLATRAHHYDSNHQPNMSYMPATAASDAGAN
jgi:hypothetical protein